jgi:hypothetical protein
MSDKVREHTFYLIPRVKIGCTKDLKKRKRKYPGGTVLITIEKRMCDDLEAEAREEYWQDYYNLPRDKHGYAKNNWSARMTKEQRQASVKKAAASRNNPSKTGLLQKLALASPNHISKKIFTCPVCSFTCKGNLGLRSHMSTHK